MSDDHTETLLTRTGFRLHVRPTRANDTEALGVFFSRVTPEDLRFRFLSTLREVSRDRLAEMVKADEGTESLVAFDDAGEIVAAAMLVGDGAGNRAEAAIALRADAKNRGIGWTLLDHLVSHAGRRGYSSVESVEHRDNRAAIALEADMGFEVLSVPGDPGLVRLRRVLKPEVAQASDGDTALGQARPAR